MSTRTLHTMYGTCTVNPRQDEIVLDGRKDRPDVQYLLHTSRGQQYFYVYRPAQSAFGEHLMELCASISHDELQEAIIRKWTEDTLLEYADLERLIDLGFMLP